MRVIVLAATSQKASVADKLIEHPDLSKIVLSVSSKKLVPQAQAIIIYFESEEDLKKMAKLLKIYSGCPLKFYFGNKRYSNFQHYYHFEQVKDLISKVTEEYKVLGESAEQIYDVLGKDEQKQQVTVDSMLTGLKSKDIIEEPCIELFMKKGRKHGKGKEAHDHDNMDGKNILVEKQKFRRWWTEGKLDNFEQIKYYLIGWMVKQVKEKKIDQEAISRFSKLEENISKFRSYKKKLVQLNQMKSHFDNHFELKIEGVQAVIPKEESKKGAIAGLAVLGKKDGKAEDTKPEKEQVTKQLAFSKVGTQIDAKFTVYPDRKEETLSYCQNLHMFSRRGWFSFGFKPKAKDLKTFIEDLNQIEYLQTLEDNEGIKTTVVLDGRKVRIGFESDEFDPLDDYDNRHIEELLDLLKVEETDKKSEKEIVQQAEFEFNISTGVSLNDILRSEDPVIVSIFKMFNLHASLKFHLKQFSKVLQATTSRKYTQYLNEKGNRKEPGTEDEPKKSDKGEEDGTEKEESEQQDEEEDEDDDSDGYGDEDDESDDDESDVSEVQSSGGFDLKSALKGFLPFFLFKWNGNVKMSPELDDLKEYCKEKKHESYLLKSFQEIVMHLKDIEIDAKDDKHVFKQAKKGTKTELIHYLIQEVGSEIEFNWRTRYFYLQGIIKTEELGNVIMLLNKAGIF